MKGRVLGIQVKASCLIAAAACVVCSPMVLGDEARYGAMDEHGVRIFSEVPEPGEHPRVIMSPEDLQPWREQVSKTYRGKPFFEKRYQSALIDKLAAIAPAIVGKDLLVAYPHEDAGSNHHLLYATMDVVYHQDAERAKVVCGAVANFARVVLARAEFDPKWGKITDSVGGIEGNRGISTGLGQLWFRGGADFALAYDYLYDSMSEDQRDVCRRALSEATKDLISWGMNFPKGRAVSNWYGYHGEMGPMILAIEGEEGYRDEQWKRFSKMIRDWYAVQIYENGGSNEDGYTINTSLREGQFAMIAMARRGQNLYTEPNLRNYFKWLMHSLVPGEDSGATVEYSSSKALPYESAPVLAKWAMPGNPHVNYYLMRYKGKDYERENRWQYANWSTLLCMNWEETPELPLEMGKLGLSETAVFPYLGMFVTRSDWSDDASYLNMVARHDAWYDRHENVDRGRFVFAALGRQWAYDRPWALATKSSDHSLVHIDGMAQAEASVGRGKAPNARLVAHADVEAGDGPGAFSYGIMDLSNAYNWQWTHSWNKPGKGWEPETRTFEELGWPWKRPGQPEKLFGCDDQKAPKYNFEGLNLWRKPNNPVEFCWRTGVLVRGTPSEGSPVPHPYTLIVDDVKKDGESRTYDWYMQLPDDVDFKPLDDSSILLVEKGEEQTYGRANVGSRRLLISFPGQTGLKIRMEEYLASKRKGASTLGRRLVVSHQGTEARFRALLYPFRTTLAPAGDGWQSNWKAHPFGAELPGIGTIGGGNEGFFIKVDGRKDEWRFSLDADGRSQCRMIRGGKDWTIEGP